MSRSAAPSALLCSGCVYAASIIQLGAVVHLGCQKERLPSPTGQWIGQMFRTLGLVQHQAENSRKRILLGMRNLGQHKAAYWSIDTPVASYGPADALPMAQDTAATAASIGTRLNPFSPREINLRLRTGYAGADASLRKQGDQYTLCKFRRPATLG